MDADITRSTARSTAIKTKISNNEKVQTERASDMHQYKTNEHKQCDTSIRTSPAKIIMRENEHEREGLRCYFLFLPCRLVPSSGEQVGQVGSNWGQLRPSPEVARLKPTRSRPSSNTSTPPTEAVCEISVKPERP